MAMQNYRGETKTPTAPATPTAATSAESQLLTSDDIIAWVRDETGFFSADARLVATEIGDGNVNYVYRVLDEETGRSVIVKYAAEFIRGSLTRKLSTARADCETRVLQLHSELAPGFVPEIYRYDPERGLIMMEDLRDITMMRIPLASWQTFPDFAEQITQFLYRTLIGTSEFVMPQMQRRALAAQLANPEMCEITERLVFTEPYLNRQQANSYSADARVQNLVHNTLYAKGSELHHRVAELKHRFNSCGEALIHGDLHTGSIFVRGDAIKIIDPEFGCFGPMGYDIGNVIANLIFALGSAKVSDDAPEEFSEWIIETICRIVERFPQLMRENVHNYTADPMLTSGLPAEECRSAGDDNAPTATNFVTYYINTVMCDTAGYAGTELIRRTVGSAKVIEITRITDPHRRAELELWLLALGVELITQAERYTTAHTWKERLER